MENPPILPIRSMVRIVSMLPQAPSRSAGRTCAALLAVGLLAGCATTERPAPRPEAADPILTQLAEASTRAAKALEGLSRVEQKRTPVTKASVDPATLPEDVKKPITLVWTGSAFEALKQVAFTIGYGVAEYGAKPTSPLIVSVNANGVAAYEVIQDIQMQLGNRAQLVPNVAEKRLKVFYSGSEANNGRLR